MDRPDSTSAARRPNVLVTAAGRRTSLVSAFVSAARERGGRVIAGDVDGLAPALYLADEAVRILPAGHERYIDDLLETVDRLDIRLVVPTIDTDLPILARSASRFAEAGCLVAVSAVEFVDIAADKHETGRAFARAGIRVPRSWIPPIDPEDLPPRVFVKPRSGSASQDIHVIDRSEVGAILGLVPMPIVQEVLTGPEITIDALLDLGGRPVHYVPRRRIRTLGGESIQGVTLDHDPAFQGWIEGVLDASAALGARGPLTLQAFQTDEGPVLSEINPRFGGGFPLALAAGADYPSWLLDMVGGSAVAARLGTYEAGLFMTRYNVERFVREPKW